MSAEFSPDGRWWWNGREWRPTISADGRFRWDGSEWRPQPQRQRRRAVHVLLAAASISTVISVAWSSVSSVPYIVRAVVALLEPSADKSAVNGLIALPLLAIFAPLGVGAAVNLIRTRTFQVEHYETLSTGRRVWCWLCAVPGLLNLVLLAIFGAVLFVAVGRDSAPIDPIEPAIETSIPHPWSSDD